MRFLIKSLLLTLALSGVAAAQEPAARAQEILKQVRAAIGDESKLASLKSISMQGTSRQVGGRGDIQTDVEIEMVFPDKIRRTVSGSMFPGADFQRIEAINGDQTPWSEMISSAPLGGAGGGGGRGPGGGGQGGPGGGGNRGFGGPGGFGGPQMDDATRIRLDFTRLLLGILAIPAPGVTPEYKWIGEAKAPDGTADVIEIKGPGDQISRLFVDRGTHRIIMLSFRGKDFRQMQQMAGRGQGAGPGGGQGSPGGQRGGQGGQPGGQPGAQPGGQPGGPGAQGGGPPQMTDEERQKRRQEMADRLAKLPDTDFFIRYSDYKSVNGLNLPHVIVNSTAGDQGAADTITSEMVISKYKINPNIKPDRFEKKEKN
jgi:hypothetical protein